MATKNHSQVRPLVWVVDSAYTGEMYARLGVAEALGYGYDIIPLPSTDTSTYQKKLLEKYTRHCNGCGTPLLIISGTGEETTAEIADLRALFDQRLFNVYLASILPDEHHPRLDEYDLIASPQLNGSNVVTLIGVPHQLTHERLAYAYQQHADYFSALPHPIIGVLIGGNTRYCDGFNQTHGQQLAQRIVKVSQTLNGYIVLTNSRRTPAEALTALLKELIDVEHHFFDWQTIEHSFYHALLAHADVLIVTGDSLSMCSEATFTGKPVLVDLSHNATESYHRAIVNGLIEHGAAKLLTDPFEPWTYTPPDATNQVVQEIRQRFHSYFG